MLRRGVPGRDPFDAVKDVALASGGRLSLSVGGEARPYAEAFRNEGWAPTGADGWVLLRLMAHAGLRWDTPTDAPRVRLFAQLKSGLAAGRDGGPRPPDRDRADWNQLFADLHPLGLLGRPAPGGAPGGAPDVFVRLGRQELNYGSGRVVSVREGPNVRRPFDGVLARVAWRGARADVALARPVVTGPGAFDDARADGEALWLIYATAPLGRPPLQPVAPGARPAALDLYYVGQDAPRAAYAVGPPLGTGSGAPLAAGLAGEERRHTLGARVSVVGARLTADVEAALQLGRLKLLDGSPSQRILAWTVAGGVARAWPGAPLRPRLALAAGAASGDGDPVDGRLGTFRAPYPPGRYLGSHVTGLGPQNLVGVRPSASVAPLPGLRVGVAAHAFWRASRSDGLYNVAGVPVRPAAPGAGRYVGVLGLATAAWALGRHAEVAVEAGRLSAGPSVRGVATGAAAGGGPPGAPVSYAGASLTYLF